MNVVRDYALPLILAVGLHAGVVGLLMQNWQGTTDSDESVMPILRVNVVEIDQPKSRPAPPKVELPPPKPQAVPAKPPPEPPPKPAAQPVPQPDREAERREREQRERERRLRELQEQSTNRVLDEELYDLQEGADQGETMSYVAGIYTAIVAEWSRPPSARNDMQARFRVDLLPSGDLKSLTMLESSGNAAFDRSAEAAVRKVGRFEVPSGKLFEDKFRRFTLLFKPEDLLR